VVQYFVGLTITLHGQITAREYVDRLSSEGHHIIHMLFPTNDAVFQDDNAPIHMAWTIQS
jgi:hypothetical protein